MLHWICVRAQSGVRALGNGRTRSYPGDTDALGVVGSLVALL